MICYVEGDILLSKCQIIGHGCNTLGIMGAGIAKPIRDRNPEMYESYRHKCLNKTFVPGDYYLWKDSTPWILNLATQRVLGQADPELIDKSLESFAKHFEKEGATSLAIPPIGCGLGSLTKEDVYPIIEKHLEPLSLRVFVYDNWIKGQESEAENMILNNA